MSEADRERWAEDHWDYQERIGAEPGDDDTPAVHDPTEDDYDPTPDDYYDAPMGAYSEDDVFERYFTNRYGRL